MNWRGFGVFEHWSRVCYLSRAFLKHEPARRELQRAAAPPPRWIITKPGTRTPREARSAIAGLTVSRFTCSGTTKVDEVCVQRLGAANPCRSGGIDAWYPKVKVGGLVSGHDYQFQAIGDGYSARERACPETRTAWRLCCCTRGAHTLPAFYFTQRIITCDRIAAALSPQTARALPVERGGSRRLRVRPWILLHNPGYTLCRGWLCNRAQVSRARGHVTTARSC